MDVVDRILKNKKSKASTLISLWAIAQLNYRQPLGDKAWEAMTALTDKDTTSALAFISGYSTAMDMTDPQLIDNLKSLVPELD